MTQLDPAQSKSNTTSLVQMEVDSIFDDRFLILELVGTGGMGTVYRVREIELDRIYCQLVYGCVIGEIVHLRRHVLPPAQEKEILIEVSLNEHQVQHIRRNVGKAETKLYFGAYVISKIHSLELAREVSTNNVRHLNCAL